jgi:hypothetical protein
MDLGFGTLLALSGADRPSVIIFRLTDESPDVVNGRLAAVLADFQRDLEDGAVVSVRNKLVGVHRLPIE